MKTHFSQFFSERFLTSEIFLWAPRKKFSMRKEKSHVAFSLTYLEWKGSIDNQLFNAFLLEKWHTYKTKYFFKTSLMLNRAGIKERLNVSFSIPIPKRGTVVNAKRKMNLCPLHFLHMECSDAFFKGLLIRCVTAGIVYYFFRKVVPSYWLTNPLWNDALSWAIWRFLIRIIAP